MCQSSSPNYSRNFHLDFLSPNFHREWLVSSSVTFFSLIRVRCNAQSFCSADTHKEIYKITLLVTLTDYTDRNTFVTILGTSNRSPRYIFLSSNRTLTNCEIVVLWEVGLLDSILTVILAHGICPLATVVHPVSSSPSFLLSSLLCTVRFKLGIHFCHSLRNRPHDTVLILLYSTMATVPTWERFSSKYICLSWKYQYSD